MVDRVEDLAKVLDEASAAAISRARSDTASTGHELKCWPEFFAPMDRGHKTFDIRKDDRGFSVGDILIQREWYPLPRKYTGRLLVYRVTYCLRDPQFVLPGYVIMGIKRMEDER